MHDWLGIQILAGMAPQKPSKAEFRVLQVLWAQGACTVREIQMGFPEDVRPAYTTVRTLVRRLETKGALRRITKPGATNTFEPLISRKVAQRSFMDEFLNLFRGQMQPAMNQLIETGGLTLEDIEATEKALRRLKEKKS
jgi:BlaI family transcriptional regulator, penicillinase repressor